jgi:proteasome lid subunit RPN8/RPN11
MSNIVLKPEHRRAIAKRGEVAYPRACRGLLLGRQEGLTKEVEELVFVDEMPEPEDSNHPYYIPPQALQDAEQRAQAQGLSVVGSFHSHVDQPAKPSIHDREYVRPSFSYVIVGIRQGRAHELAAWTLSEDGTAFFQEDIRS